MQKGQKLMAIYKILSLGRSISDENSLVVCII